jgi:hypothetical protein
LYRYIPSPSPTLQILAADTGYWRHCAVLVDKMELGRRRAIIKSSGRWLIVVAVMLKQPKPEISLDRI